MSDDDKQKLLEAEARELLTWDKPRRVAFLERASVKRGKAAIDMLKAEIMRQHKEGK